MEKPKKPSPDFPLFPHASGRWAKKVKKANNKWGFVYFGPWDDPEGALANYESQYGPGASEKQDNVPPTKREVKRRPEKPWPDFPLYAHAEGKWCIKIKGISHYFGQWDDPEGAYNEFKDVEDDLRAGRPIIKGDGLSVRELCNRFLNSREKRLKTGEFNQSTWDDYNKGLRKDHQCLWQNGQGS